MRADGLSAPGPAAAHNRRPFLRESPKWQLVWGLMLRAFATLPVLLLIYAAPVRADVETIVCLRHGEKTPVEIGQLSVQGLNRSLALPQVLLSRFGTPNFIFAPDPDIDLVGGIYGEKLAYYLRPLATIEPTAIKCGLPVNTAFGYKHIAELETELLKPGYSRALVFVAWEHHYLARFIGRLESDVEHRPIPPVPWPSKDYDSLYVIRIERNGGRMTLSLAHEHEGLDGLSSQFPQPAGGQP